MNEGETTQAYFAGKFLPATAVAIPFWDRAVTSGAAVSEQLRTWDVPGLGRRLVFAERHWRRFFRGLDRLRIELGLTADDLQTIAERLIAANGGKIPSDQPLGVSFLASPGTLQRWAPREVADQGSQPWLLVYTFELPVESQSPEAECVSLWTTSQPEVPPASLPKDFKHRNRLHYYLAELEAETHQPGARPLLLNARGEVCESSAGALLAWIDGGWVAPPREEIFASVTLAVIEENAAREGGPLLRRPIRAGEFRGATEVVWGNTPGGLRAVTQIDGQPIGDGKPGPRFRALRDRYRGWALASAREVRNAALP